MLRRLRFNPPPCVEPSTIDWRVPALILSTLFLNFTFWWEHSLDTCLPGTLVKTAILLGVVSLVAVVLSFLGPALLAQAARLPLLKAIEYSLGSVPAFAVRICCVLFLTGWIAKLSAWWWYAAGSIWHLSSAQSWFLSATVLLFLFVTGLQGLQINGKLAQFTIRLAIAFLVAALLRVHEGWPAAFQGFPASGGCAAPSRLWFGLGSLFAYVGPVGFLAADFGNQAQRRVDVLKIGLYGLMIPLSATLLVLVFICLATLASPFYQPSLEPNIMMALWGKSARPYADGFLLVSAVTVFGAVRFAVMGIGKSLPMVRAGYRRRWIWVGLLVAILASLSIHQAAARTLTELSALCLVATSAVLTSDWLTKHPQATRIRRLDWIGAGALVAGCSTRLYVQNSVLSTYALAFAISLCGRLLQKALTAQQSRGGPRGPASA